MKHLFLVGLLLVFLLSCNEDSETCNIDIALVDCLGFPAIGFEILIEEDNIFDSRELTVDDIRVQPENTEIQLFLQSGFSSTDGTILFIQDNEWTTGNFDYTLFLSDTLSFDMGATFTLSGGGPCCGAVPLVESVQINGNRVERDSISGFFNVNF